MDDQTAEKIRELLLRARDLEQEAAGLRSRARRLILNLRSAPAPSISREVLTMTETHRPCPSCGQQLHLTPKRKGKCKACGETFLLNKKGRLFGPLVTEKQARTEHWFSDAII
jgi:transposase-like protein